ncbi:dTDP-glucose 4,6-dehydratase [Kineococcus sp. TBRC 1896]|uniref:dTDP-glucose 4,6-dehydratase n=1 Tax=Kineococcus mangrovi TaxID=1660183 RepID=A0ABV4I0B7_9ACTN
MKVLVTGGAGFIGSHWVRRALSAAPGVPDVTELVVLDRFTYAGNPANLDPVVHDPRLRVVRGDVADAAVAGPLVAAADVVVHFAAETHVDRSIARGADFARTNVIGTQVLLEAAARHGVEKFVHVSTDEVYGSIPRGSWTEDSPLEPNSPYSASKASADLLVRAYGRTHGVPVCTTRCSNNYGPHQFPEKVVPLFVTTLLRGGSVPLYGDGANVRDWLHVDDHCRGIDLVVRAGRPGEVYNIGGGTELTNRELTERVLHALGADWSRVRHVPDRPGHDLRYSVDCRKARDELGYAPVHDFATGLAETVEWYRTHEDWWRPLIAA